jgi:gliding motility associated protien GldN
LDDITTAKRTFDPHEVVRFRIKEITYFDSKLSRMNTRIIGIAPIKQFYSSNGDLLSHTPICWFYFDEIRPLLASESSFNSNNDIKSFSWDDVFLSRYFSSFIVKESNVNDARLADMYSGIDVLHEGEKIKEGIRNYEGDLFGN